MHGLQPWSCLSQAWSCKELVALASSFPLFRNLHGLDILLHGHTRIKLGHVAFWAQFPHLSWYARLEHDLNMIVVFTCLASIHLYFASFVPNPNYLFNEAQNTKSSTKNIKRYARRQAKFMQKIYRHCVHYALINLDDFLQYKF